MARHSTHDRLLAAGRQSIHAHGFAATGVQEITAAAGVPKGSFYNHFPSKAAFGLAALDSYWADGAALRAPLHASGGSAMERLRAHFQAVAAAGTAQGLECGCLIGNFAIEAPAAGPQIATRVAEIHRDWTAALAGCIAEGAAAAEIRRDLAPEDLARMLLAAWQGSVQRAKVEPQGLAFDAFFRALDRLLAP